MIIIAKYKRCSTKNPEYLKLKEDQEKIKQKLKEFNKYNGK